MKGFVLCRPGSSVTRWSWHSEETEGKSPTVEPDFFKVTRAMSYQIQHTHFALFLSLLTFPLLKTLTYCNPFIPSPPTLLLTLPSPLEHLPQLSIRLLCLACCCSHTLPSDAPSPGYQDSPYNTLKSPSPAQLSPRGSEPTTQVPGIHLPRKDRQNTFIVSRLILPN